MRSMNTREDWKAKEGYHVNLDSPGFVLGYFHSRFFGIWIDLGGPFIEPTFASRRFEAQAG